MNRKIEFLTSKTKFAIILSFVTLLLMQTIAYQKVYGQTTDSQKDPFSWEIKPNDVDPEFLRKWDYNLNPPSQLQENTEQKQIRIIYLVASDKAVRNDYKSAIADAILNLQDFYKRELGNGVTFSLHSPIVEVYQTTHTASWYATNPSRPNAPQSIWFWENALKDGFDLTGGGFNDPNNRWVYYIDADPACGQVIGGNAGVALLSANDFRGLVGEQNIPRCSNEQPDNGGRDRWIGGLGHELAHTFNVPHPPGCGGSGPNQGCTGGAFAQSSLMWIGYAFYPNTYFLPEDKQILLNSGFFSQASNCIFSLSPASQSFTSAGGSNSITVNTANGCAWSTHSNNSWITVTAGTAGSGSGTVSYSVAANTGPARTGTITSAGQTFTVTQSAGTPACSYSVAQVGIGIPEISASGGTRSFSITTQSGCFWTAASNAAWITLASSGSGSGNGTVTFNIASNTGPSRLGTVTIAGQSFNLFQQNGQQPSGKKLFDFDGDGKTDLSIFRPAVGEWWYLRSSDGGNRTFQFGSSSDKLVPADYTGDGRTDIAFFRPSTSEWFILRSENNSFYSFPFGTNGDIPAPADYDGDGKADPAVFRPSNTTWFISRSSGGTTIQQFGIAGDVPVTADYDGDGKSDLAIYRPSQGQWWLSRSSLGVIVYQFGVSTDKPVQGDYTGDGKVDVAFFRPSTNEWFVLRSENNSFYSFPFGAANDIPSPGDYDGDGKFDAAIFRPSNSTWFVQRSSSGTLIQGFGIAGDKPIPNVFVP